MREGQRSWEEMAEGQSEIDVVSERRQSEVLRPGDIFKVDFELVSKLTMSGLQESDVLKSMQSRGLCNKSSLAKYGTM